MEQGNIEAVLTTIAEIEKNQALLGGTLQKLKTMLMLAQLTPAVMKGTYAVCIREPSNQFFPRTSEVLMSIRTEIGTPEEEEHDFKAIEVPKHFWPDSLIRAEKRLSKRKNRRSL